MVIGPNTVGEITQNYCEKLNVDEVEFLFTWPFFQFTRVSYDYKNCKTRIKSQTSILS